MPQKLEHFPKSKSTFYKRQSACYKHCYVTNYATFEQGKKHKPFEITVNSPSRCSSWIPVRIVYHTHTHTHSHRRIIHKTSGKNECTSKIAIKKWAKQSKEDEEEEVKKYIAIRKHALSRVFLFQSHIFH